MNDRFGLWVAGVLIVCVLGALVWFVALRGAGGSTSSNAAASWDGQRTFACIGTHATLTGRHVSMPRGAAGADEPFLHGCQNESGGCPLIFASTGCVLDVIDSNLSAPVVVLAFGDARVTFRNSAVHGEVVRGRNVIVTGVPGHEIDERNEARARRLAPYARTACDGIADCYRHSEVWGTISGRLSVAIAADGRATEARYENGTAPDVVQQCLIALGRTRRVVPFAGEHGRMVCDYVGTLVPTAERMDYSPSYVPE